MTSLQDDSPLRGALSTLPDQRHLGPILVPPWQLVGALPITPESRSLETQRGAWSLRKLSHGGRHWGQPVRLLSTVSISAWDPWGMESQKGGSHGQRDRPEVLSRLGGRAMLQMSFPQGAFS